MDKRTVNSTSNSTTGEAWQRAPGVAASAVNGAASVSAAVERVVDTSQRLLQDSWQLTRYEIKTFLREQSMGVAQILGGLVFVLLGWLTVMATLVVVLRPWIDYRVSLAVVGLVHLAVGIAAALRGATMLSSSAREHASIATAVATEAKTTTASHGSRPPSSLAE